MPRICTVAQSNKQAPMDEDGTNVVDEDGTKGMATM